MKAFLFYKYALVFFPFFSTGLDVEAFLLFLFIVSYVLPSETWDDTLFLLYQSQTQHPLPLIHTSRERLWHRLSDCCRVESCSHQRDALRQGQDHGCTRPRNTSPSEGVDVHDTTRPRSPPFVSLLQYCKVFL